LLNVRVIGLSIVTEITSKRHCLGGRPSGPFQHTDPPATCCADPCWSERPVHAPWPQPNLMAMPRHPSRHLLLHRLGASRTCSSCRCKLFSGEINLSASLFTERRCSLPDLPWHLCHAPLCHPAPPCHQTWGQDTFDKANSLVGWPQMGRVRERLRGMLSCTAGSTLEWKHQRLCPVMLQPCQRPYRLPLPGSAVAQT
jgi:hypothetical protein